MRRTFLCGVVFLPWILLLIISAAQAGSIFSGNGQGEVIYPADARLRAMGGAGMALTEGLSGSLVNPALLGGLKWAAVTFSSRPEALYVKDAWEENVLTTVRVHDFALYLPLGKGLAVGLDLRQKSDFRFKTFQEISIFDKTYTKSVTCTGGMSLASVSLARVFGNSLYVGVRAGHLFGKTSKSWKGNFSDTAFHDTQTTSERENTGSQLGGGMAFKLSRRLSVGAIFIAAHEVEQKEVRSSTFSPTTTEKRTLTYPLTFGLGLAYRPSPKLMAQIDVTATKWSGFEIDGESDSLYTDVIRVAAGCEFVARQEGSMAYLRKIPLRLGYALEPWYLKTVDGERIYAHFLTIGIGLPFGQKGAHLDASLELGMRGDVSSVGTEEKIVRGTFSLWGFEPWFQRRK